MTETRVGLRSGARPHQGQLRSGSSVPREGVEHPAVRDPSHADCPTPQLRVQSIQLSDGPIGALRDSRPLHCIAIAGQLPHQLLRNSLLSDYAQVLRGRLEVPELDSTTHRHHPHPPVVGLLLEVPQRAHPGEFEPPVREKRLRQIRMAVHGHPLDHQPGPSELDCATKHAEHSAEQQPAESKSVEPGNHDELTRPDSPVPNGRAGRTRSRTMARRRASGCRAGSCMLLPVNE